MASVLIRPLSQQLLLNQLRPMKGAHKQAQRVGRGGKRGGTSGRGLGGQKHHANKPAPWFTGLYTNPIIHALPRWLHPISRSTLLTQSGTRKLSPKLEDVSETWFDCKARYKTLSLERLQFFIDTGRIDPTKKITVADLVRSRCIQGGVLDGVKLLATGAEYFTHKLADLEVERISHAAVQRIEQLGGRVTSVYRTRASIQYLLACDAFKHAQTSSTKRNNTSFQQKDHVSLPPTPPHIVFPPPTSEQDRLYYTNPLYRGYMSDSERFESVFRPRGFVKSWSEYDAAEKASDTAAQITLAHSDIKLGLSDEEKQALLKKVNVERAERKMLEDEQNKKAMEEEEKKRELFVNQRWFPNQPDQEWVSVQDGQVINRFRASSSSPKE